MSVYDDIKAERARQDAQWGGPEHDDRHGYEDWRQYRLKFEDRLYADVWGNEPPYIIRDSLVKVAALAVAQIESIDRRQAPPNWNAIIANMPDHP